MGKKVERFEDLFVWQKARSLTKAVYTTKKGAFARDYGLSGQIQRAAVSTSTIAEGFERGGRAEFQQYLAVSKGSCAELRSQLYIALDIGYLDENTFQQLLPQAEEVSKRVSRLQAFVRKQRDSTKVKE